MLAPRLKEEQGVSTLSRILVNSGRNEKACPTSQFTVIEISVTIERSVQIKSRRFESGELRRARDGFVPGFSALDPGTRMQDLLFCYGEFVSYNIGGKRLAVSPA
jgi:hypothetical protein